MTDSNDEQTVPVRMFEAGAGFPSLGGTRVVEAEVDDPEESDDDPVETFCRNWQAYLDDWPESLSKL